MVVISEFWVELVCLAIEESVVAIETALKRPLLVGTGCGAVLHRAEVPFTESEGCVALVAQYLSNS
ncbi:unannotated protein [freshwater metagenome]|uniref:Unannotated protein n=1 Tax=freshwater metagenome TaxID=449393 RepID=A0A6J6MK83_9ZZZZ